MSVAETLVKAISERCPAITELSVFPIQPFFPPYDPESDHDSPSDSYSDFSDGGISDSEAAYDPNATRFSPRRLASTNDSDDPDDPDNFDTNLAKGFTVPTRYFDHLKNTHYLRTLTTSSFILDPDALLILGNLPQLEKLDLYCSYFDEDLSCYDSSIVPGRAFPSLRTLRLLLPHMDTVRYIWGTKPLVSRLTNITIKLQAGASDYHASGSASLMSFIPKICARSPNIQEFTLDFDATQGQVHVIPREMLQALVALPLRNLDLRHALLEHLPQACQILQQCRTLRDLHIQDQTISYEDLLCFAQMPGLECVHAEVNWMDMQALQKCRNITLQRPSSIRFLHCSNAPYFARDPAALLDITRLLYSWFPNLEEVSWVGTSMCGVAPGTVDGTYVLVNSILKQIKEHMEKWSRINWWA
ncbi:hypothetical protein FS749_012919 [Ceratobasidium sp. UAMH 11750]|nr:hypothetical protein FS749_012919 [Ceratobasidium sp. UAMH 11750]